MTDLRVIFIDKLFAARPLHIIALSLAILFLPASVFAQATYASAERSAKAIGHYARARTLLVEALSEFEAGRRAAQPDVLLDPEEWRISIVSRTEELNRLLDPQPRVTRGGVRFKADSLRVQRSYERTARPDYGAQDANNYGEEQRAAELKAIKKPPSAEAQAPKVITNTGPYRTQLENQRAAETAETRANAEAEAEANTDPHSSSPSTAAPEGSIEQTTTSTNKEKEEDIHANNEAVSEAIARAIETRLQKIKSSKSKDNQPTQEQKGEKEGDSGPAEK